MTSDEPGAGLRSGQAAAFAGVTVRALSHYRRLGLVHPARNSSGYWRYSPADLAAVVRIRALRELGLGLDEIGVLVAADAAAGNFPDVLTSLRTDLKRRAAALTVMAESVEQLLTGSGAASAELPWRDLVDAQGTPGSPSSGPGGPEQQRLAALLDSAEVGAALKRLEPRLRGLRDAPVSSPDVDPLAQELAAALPADLLPVAVADTAMLMVLLGRRFSAAQLRCVLAAGRIAHDTRPDAGGPR